MDESTATVAQAFESAGRHLGVLRPVAAFPAWATCRPSSTAFGGAFDNLVPTLRSSSYATKAGAQGFNRRQVACVKGGDRSPHSRALARRTSFQSVRWFGIFRYL